MPLYDPTAAQAPISTVAYAEFNTDIAISTTTEAAATVIVTAPPFIPNGIDSFWVEFYVPGAQPASSATAALIFVLYDNGVAMSPARIAQFNCPAAGAMIMPVFTRRRIVSPSAASHTYSVRCYRVTADGTVLGSLTSTGVPGYINITRAA